MPLISVILPTRNRPDLFRVALDSVLAQRDADFEIIVVHDGSEAEHVAAYQALFAEYAERIRLIELLYRSRGHGHAYGINTGVKIALGEYFAFLDDDDQWIDDLHLSRVCHSIARLGRLDMYLANQEAWHLGRQLPPPIWIGDLLQKVPNLPGPDPEGCYKATAADMVRAHGFCHLNTLIMHRDLFAAIKGVDEYLRYECDRDFYYRALDRAQTILYDPKFIARHHVPLVGKMANVSTQVSGTEKCLFQMFILGRLHLSVKSPAIRAYAWKHRAYTLQRLVRLYAEQKLYRTALPYAVEAVALRPSPNSFKVLLRLIFKALLLGDVAGSE